MQNKSKCYYVFTTKKEIFIYTKNTAHTMYGWPVI